MGFLKEIKAILTKHDLVLMEHRQEQEDIHSYRFNIPSSLTWKAGQHGLFFITHRQVKQGLRPFSIASAPTDPYLQITTRISCDQPSEFKKALSELRPGMSIGFRGPAGSMVVSQPSRLVCIAAGLGITPFRAILRDKFGNPALKNSPVHVIHYDSAGHHLFDSDIMPVKDNGSCHLSHPSSRDALIVQIQETAQQYGNQAMYLLSGPANMTKHLSGLLIGQGIHRKQIRKDLYCGQ